MKKILFTIITLFIMMTSVGAMSTSMNCPDTATASASVTCTVNITPGSFPACSFRYSYSVENGSNVNMSSTFNITNTGSGVSADIPDASCFSGNTKVGTITFTMPTSGSATVNFGNFEITDSAGEEIEKSGSISRTIRIKSTVNTLSSLSISPVAFNETFNPETTRYTATVPGTVTSITINADKTDANSSISGTGQKNLNYGPNQFDVFVTSESGAKKVYTIIVTRQDNREDVKTLSSLSISGGTISPSFVSTTYSYTAKVAASVSKITISATKTSAKATFVNGYGGRDVNLEYGSNKVFVKVLSEKGNEQAYLITVTRQDDRSTNNYLKTLTDSEKKLSFVKTKTEYVMTVNYDVEKVKFEGTVEDAKATVTGLGEKTLNVGANVFNIVVTAENKTTKTYKITVTRLSQTESPSSNTNLTSLKIADHEFEFKQGQDTYEIELGENETELNLEYLVEDPTSVVEVTGNKDLKNGSIVTVTITSTDGSVKSYQIVINKPSDNVVKQDLTSGVNKGTGKKSSTKLIVSIISIIVCVGLIVGIVLIILKKKKSKIEVIEIE